MSGEPGTRERVLALLRRFGAHATSFQILEEGYSYWFDPNTDGVIAYVDSWRYRVVAGVPVASRKDLGAVTARFVEDARGLGKRALFFSADDDFLDVLRRTEGLPEFASVPIGEQPEWDPRAYSRSGSSKRTLRAQVNRARNKGVRVKAVSAADLTETPGLRAQIELVSARWLEDRKMSAMRFLVDLQPFTFPEERRYYIAEREGRAVGFLAAIPVYQRSGWFFEDVIRVPEAPNGTAELLIDTAMEDAKNRASNYVTLGLAPLAGVTTEPGPGLFLRHVFAWSYRSLGPLYHFPGLRRFKARFHPEVWSPQYLVACPAPVGILELHSVLRAFAGGGVVSFGVDTARRLMARMTLQWWSGALYAFAVLLIPWTLLLALADGEEWFGDASIHIAWVVFDACMILALAALARLVWLQKSVARTLGVFLAGATLTDFVLTTAQATHLHREAGGWALLFILAGMAGPALATAFLVALATAAPIPSPRARKGRWGHRQGGKL